VFKISDVPGAYRQVKYACVVSGGPEEAWLEKRGLVHVYNKDGDNVDGFVNLHWSNSRERHTWKAVDAQDKIRISVFFAPPHSVELPRQLFLPGEHRAQKQSTQQGEQSSPDEPLPPIYSQSNSTTYGSRSSSDDELHIGFGHMTALADVQVAQTEMVKHGRRRQQRRYAICNGTDRSLSVHRDRYVNR